MIDRFPVFYHPSIGFSSVAAKRESGMEFGGRKQLFPSYHAHQGSIAIDEVMFQSCRSVDSNHCRQKNGGYPVDFTEIITQ